MDRDSFGQVGTMNLFVVFRQEDGSLELVTPPLDGMILPGVTRDSVLSLARSHAAGTLRIPQLPSKLSVSERSVTMKEVCEAAQSGRLVEMFGAGQFTFLCFFFGPGFQLDVKARLRLSAPSIRLGIKDGTWIYLWRKMEWAQSHERSGLN